LFILNVIIAIQGIYTSGYNLDEANTIGNSSYESALANIVVFCDNVYGTGSTGGSGDWGIEY